MKALYPARIFDEFRSRFLATSRYKAVLKDEHYGSKPISTYLHTVAYSDRSYQNAFAWWDVDGKVYFSLHLTTFSPKYVARIIGHKPVKTLAFNTEKIELTKYGCMVSPERAKKILSAIGIDEEAAKEKAFRKES